MRKILLFIFIFLLFSIVNLMSNEKGAGVSDSKTLSFSFRQEPLQKYADTANPEKYKSYMGMAGAGIALLSVGGSITFLFFIVFVVGLVGIFTFLGPIGIVLAAVGGVFWFLIGLPMLIIGIVLMSVGLANANKYKNKVSMLAGTDFNKGLIYSGIAIKL